MLMIDEPELNLHPVNQRRMARFLAKLVNTGVKVFVTTHSDYIIKEFNTLIMLNRRLPHYIRIQKDFGYQEAQILAPEQVALYMTKNIGTKRKPKYTLERAKIAPHLGLEAITFDDSIDEMNQIQDEIRYGGE
ncbi:AAA ATPase domain-containing protein [Nitrosomonas communis]|uniref:AAA ATPase domain-containing protein n=2 Tax=Nitrosomonas communis TaxID=44574 RepID=A0A1I4PFQ9_9PROT|nr:AAA ATPase domain-containing protein [Nitrosomonas communis]